MSIQYVIDRPCRLKEEIPLKEIFKLRKIKSILDVVDQSTFMPVSETKRFIVDHLEDGVIKTESITVAAMREYILPLLKYKNFCNKCPVNIFQRECGCCGEIQFPVEKEVEYVLYHTVRLVIENHWEDAAGYFIKELACKVINTQQIKQMRKCYTEPVGSGQRYPVYFELSEGIEYSWGGKWIFCKNNLSTDDIFQYAFFSGTLGDRSLVMLASFFSLFYDVAKMELDDLRLKDKIMANRFYNAVYEFQDYAAALTKAAKNNYTFTVVCEYSPNGEQQF
ncbi:hypothetical protein Tfer_0177 [Thermincola ferriacetica]|uniref:Uncharacterized protein n=1 Tax=Thermincola ferriacetica TaxID=281456 RepID=A0A0L6W6L1_9FIRM|nr:hypothetical protein [Thermincola ferriacetica]KNZ71101.1 hypothetical protein Tfer_0177 [Thermincola ferriacetica]